jgi:hypothetical protein
VRTGKRRERGGESADFGMIDAGKFLRGGVGDDAAALKKDDARGEQQRFTEIVGDEDDGFAEAAGKGAEFALKLGAGNGIERTEGLVHKEDRRVGSKSPRYADALALSARKFVRLPRRELDGIKAHEGEKFIDAGGGASGVPMFKSGDKRNVLGHAEMGEKPRFLNYIADAAAEPNGIPFGGGAAADDDLAGAGNKEAIDEFKERGLAATAAT